MPSPQQTKTNDSLTSSKIQFLENGGITSELSSKTEDQEWDIFLQQSPLGQYQQSSAWAKYKQIEGWHVLRSVFRYKNSIVGGFQILWKQTKKGKISYVSKGPILNPKFSHLSKPTTTLLQRIASEQGFKAIIIQPPDEAVSISETLKESGFLTGDYLRVIDSTLWIDVTGSTTDIMSGIRSSSRNRYNKAVRNGLVVREGTKKDIPAFFDLMLATCKRQGVTPNPPTLEAIETLWSSLSSQNMVRLTICVLKDEIISGELFICFGKRLSIFKTGWSGHYREYFPNNLVICEALKWASNQDFEIADFVGLERGLALTRLRGEKVSEKQNHSRDAFKLAFGGRPKLLPPASLWIPNPALRYCLRFALLFPFVRNKLRHLV
jgi:peptidoglycan pentaglycine glycine transferase (the first glycine)